ncbi:MAG: phosphopentomutase [Defluviitaleaceae bacterium]|nr:phosphopentomutase [Defluviitaleaceae bacterium]MCL2264153.1 phosphopentomutase [Defluviitaleaceae bacterium]
MNRVCIIVLDSVGIGALPDASEYGDVGAHTLGNVYAACKPEIPNLLAIGLGNIEGSRLPQVENPTAAFGRMAEKTRAKDTTSGHWEMTGIVVDPPFRVVEKFPNEMLEEWLKRAGRDVKWLGNLPASGTEIIARLGAEHMETGAPIVYTSADSVFQVAAHERIIPLNELYRLCEIAREMLIDDLFMGRVIARPFIGEAGAFSRTENRKDYAVPPTGKTVLDALEERGKTTLGIGKIEDIFCNRGISEANHTKNNADGISATIDALKTDRKHAIIFTNLVDFDMKFGHRNDVTGYAKALEEFDAKLPEILAALRPEDLLIITADHGCDPTTHGTDHTREYVPVLAYPPANAQNLGTRETFADIAATIYAGFGFGAWDIGKSFF